MKYLFILLALASKSFASEVVQLGGTIIDKSNGNRMAFICVRQDSNSPYTQYIFSVGTYSKADKKFILRQSSECVQYSYATDAISSSYVERVRLDAQVYLDNSLFEDVKNWETNSATGAVISWGIVSYFNDEYSVAGAICRTLTSIVLLPVGVAYDAVVYGTVLTIDGVRIVGKSTYIATVVGPAILISTI